MSPTAGQVHFRLEKGDLKLPECIKAAQAAMLKLSPLDVVRSATSPGFWSAAAKSIPDLVVKMVDVNVADVLVNAWKTHRKFKKFTDQTKYPAGVPAVVPLLSHDISAGLEPYIEITVDGTPQGRIEFELELTVSVAGGNLVILNRRIMRMEGGSTKATGTLKCGDEVICEGTTREFPWKDGIDFGQGIEITAN